MGGATLVFVVLAVAMLTKAWQARGLPRDGCSRTCGDVEVPFPFGLSDEGGNCSFLEDYQLECNRSYNPPKLFIGIDFEVTSVKLLEGELAALFPISYVCYSTRTNIGFNPQHIGGSFTATGATWNLSLNSAYLVSTTNVHTAVGCETWSLMEIGGGNYGGCISGCSSLDNVTTGECTGVGCCEVPIPKGTTNYASNFSSRGNNSLTYTFNNCSYSFLVERNYYRFDKNDVRGMDSERKFPFMLDWAIRTSSTCEEALRDRATYACVSSNSDCVDSTNGPGYLCNCSRGYQGNPYEQNGCKDIDECGSTNKLYYPCHGSCKNTEGSYNCTCREGEYSDDPRTQRCIPIGKANQTKTIRVIIGTSCGIFLILILSSLSGFAIQRRKLHRLRRKFFEKHGGYYLQEVLLRGRKDFRIFSMAELEKATNKFDEGRALGSGGFGTVYKGITEEQQVIAVKKSKVVNDKSGMDLANEIYVLSNVNHENIVQMVGCCLEDELPILVYAYIPNGTLFSYIHGRIKHKIPFATRIRIAKEIAQALKYLHKDLSPPILHGDVKSPNVLLDEGYAVKVSDFGTSKLVPTDKEKFTTYVQGTYGYLDPEWLQTGQMTEKSDVYSFGVVLLELLTRRLPVDFNALPGEEKSLAANFLTCVENCKALEILDPEILEDGIVTVEVRDAVEIARECLSVKGTERPTMDDVLSRLECIKVQPVPHPWVPYGSEGTSPLLGGPPSYNLDVQNSAILSIGAGR